MAEDRQQGDVDDHALIRAYRGGDASAFDKVFSRYHVRIRSLCQRYVGDGNLAEDLVQETFYNVLKTLDRIDDSFNFSAWIHRIAVNLCHDELRRQQRVHNHVEPGGDGAEEAVLRLVDLDRERDPQGALEMAQLRQMVWDIAKRLPERQRMVLTLRELQGLSYSAIGQVMGISQPAVETLLHRARRRFKDEYLASEGAADATTECATVRYLLENVRHANLRKDQRRMLADHLDGCDSCRERFPQRAVAASLAGVAARLVAAAAPR